MTFKHTLQMSTLLLFTLTMAACSNTKQLTTEPAQATAVQSGQSQSGQSQSEQSASDMEALFWAVRDSAKTRFTQADVDFMTGMIGHHAQALVMSALAPTNGANQAVSTLAARIINAQNDEIAIMQQWLRDRDQPVPEVHIDGLNLMIHGAGHHHDHMKMAGMLSQEQLEELAEAKDGEFDRLYLTYMIQHHRGAITMVDELFAQEGAGQDEASFKLASDINVDQETEIARMRLMLSRLPSNGN